MICVLVAAPAGGAMERGMLMGWLYVKKRFRASMGVFVFVLHHLVVLESKSPDASWCLTRDATASSLRNLSWKSFKPIFSLIFYISKQKYKSWMRDAVVSTLWY